MAVLCRLQRPSESLSSAYNEIEHVGKVVLQTKSKVYFIDQQMEETVVINLNIKILEKYDM